MSGTISRLLKHDRIKELTHDRLPVYFGRANTSLLVHGGRCVENERLVNADGQNVYVTDANIRQHLRMPVAILHGRHNALFDVESALRTWQQLRRVNPDLHTTYVKIVAKDYAHFDCTIGYGLDMQKQILRPLRGFYNRAWRFHEKSSSTGTVWPGHDTSPDWVLRSFAKPALAGPLVGWNRTEVRGGRTYRKLRLWIEVDETEADRCDCVVTDCLNGGRGQRWPVLRVPLTYRPAVPGAPARPDVALLEETPIEGNEAYIAISLPELEFDVTDGWDTDLEVRVYSLHHMVERNKDAPGDPATATRADRAPGTPQAATPHASPKLPADAAHTPAPKRPAADIARPLTPGEYRRGQIGGQVPLSDIDILKHPLLEGFFPRSTVDLGLSPAPGQKRHDFSAYTQLWERALTLDSAGPADTGPVSDDDADQLWETLLAQHPAPPRCGLARRPAHAVAQVPPAGAASCQRPGRGAPARASHTRGRAGRGPLPGCVLPPPGAGV